MVSLMEHFLRFMAGSVLIVFTSCSFTSATGSFFSDVSPFFDFLVPSVGDACQQLAWGREGFDFKGGELGLDKQPPKSTSGREAGMGEGYLLFLRSFLGSGEDLRV